MLDQSISDLFNQYQSLVEENGALRAKDAAEKLGVSEAELVEAKMAAGATHRLRRCNERGFAELLEGLVGLGEVMCLTRNEHAVHERYGEFDNVNIGSVMGLVLNRTIDLRIFMQRWAFGFVIEEQLSSGLRISLQFFDKFGAAVHKIYPTEKTDRPAFDTLVANWIDPDADYVSILPAPVAEAERPDSEIDIKSMRADWEAMTDVHQFMGLLSKYKVGRMQALRLIGNDYAYLVPTDSITWALEKAAENEVPIMVFVGSYGCIQIHSGTVNNIKAMGPWINVLDEKFHMHLRQDHVAYAWVVKKPSKDGFVTSLEAFNEAGENFCIMFGERSEGNAELETWRSLLDGLGREVAS